MKKIAIFMAAAMLLLSIAGCGSKKDEVDLTSKDVENEVITETQEPEKDEELKNEEATVQDKYARKIYFTIYMDDGGEMKGELYPDLAPVTVDNFVKLCNNKFYDGLIFHRVIEGFMIQGGGFNDEYEHKKANTIKGEFQSNGIENDLKHTRGVISMARATMPDSASSQFFIMHADYPSLDGQYAAFGKITEGLDIVDEIATCQTAVFEEMGMEDVPVIPCVIKTITIDK